ncbi:DUF5906 domain-containing protein [Profundibacter amoris]|uniref:NrS-1 polymerase-like helicase domain-containing protein n=1 Tax=Profundibacter amoris TaxID=2171755 RepID=A0A347UEH6_9RHOB|nr:DUF5906 domain-containing protein [Profundibacter amoris]AXX97254.1 hypothetical protein BAR1_04475 [Profundibacter amoris]
MDQTFKNLFAGNEERFLTFSSMKKREDGKMVPDYRTIKRGVSDQDWARHIKGETSLGLSPLHDGMVKWGAIDVDLYPVLESDDEVEALMKAWRDPCLIARSKSGGVHIIAFSNDWVPAERMRAYLEAKRDAILDPVVIEHAKEVFPKQNDGDGSQMNLPAFGNERSVLAWRSATVIAYVSDEHPVQWDQVEGDCHVSDGIMADAMLAALTPKPKARKKRTTERKKSAGGFKHPEQSEGRRDYLFKCAASARSRGADKEQLEEIIGTVNDSFADPDHEYGAKGPITENQRLNVIIQEVMKFEQGSPTNLSYDVVERMNAEWAMMMVDGRVEFLHQPSGVCYPLRDFTLRTKPMTCMVNGKVAQMSDMWIRDPDRLEYDGIVIESPEYDGPGWNVFQGWRIKPKPGDASLWVDYVERILCGGNKELAHWVMTFIADGVQRPWSLHPGTALALRGAQGGGKSFLGNMLTRILHDDQAQEIANSDRMFERFNRGMFGATFVLAEESVFAGSSKQANTLKAFITSPRWSYEQKFLASFTGKNVHRMIATTNDEQAVHLDDDDRRWTVVEVANMFDDPDSGEAREYWKPYWDLDPGVVLGYLLGYEVDRELIGRPIITEAKRADKIMSDPVLEVLHEIAESGIVFDDLDGNGRLAISTLYREARARGAGPYDKPRVLGERAKKILGWKGTCRNAMHIKEYQRTVDGDGVPTMHPILENGGHARGIDLKSLSDFRAAVSRRTGVDYDNGGGWKRFKTPSVDFRVGDPEDVEKAYSERQRAIHGEDIQF